MYILKDKKNYSANIISETENTRFPAYIIELNEADEESNITNTIYDDFNHIFILSIRTKIIFFLKSRKTTSFTIRNFALFWDFSSNINLFAYFLELNRQCFLILKKLVFIYCRCFFNQNVNLLDFEPIYVTFTV